MIGTATIPVPGGFPSERFANANATPEYKNNGAIALFGVKWGGHCPPPHQFTHHQPIPLYLKGISALTAAAAWRRRFTLSGSAKMGLRLKVTRMRKIVPPGVQARR